MKVKVIGSGSMWNKYNSACYLIDNNIMVDFPNGACKYLYRFNIEPSNIEYLLLTHFHGDHYFDVPFYILNKSKNDNKKATIFCSKDGVKKINKIGKLAFHKSFKRATNEIDLKYNFDEEFNIEDYYIKKILVDHGSIKPSFGYIFNYEDVNIGFTGDTCFCKNVEYMASVCKYLFCDCMLIKGNNRHQGIDNIKYLSKKYNNCIFALSHLDVETRNKLKEEKISNVIILEDGLEISI